MAARKHIFTGSQILSGNNSSIANRIFLKMAAFKWFRAPSRPSPDELVANLETIYEVIVPVPKEIEHGSNILYVDDVNIVDSIEGISDTLDKVFTLGIGNVAGFAGLDRTNSVFSRNEKRKYNLKFTLVATDGEEALEISRIANALETLTLPSLSYNQSNRLTTFPPLWLFGIGKDIDKRVEPSWLGQPSFCVLQSATISPTAGGFPYVLNISSNNMPIPLITSISLNFIEFEPAFRNEFDILNRSDARYSVS